MNLQNLILIIVEIILLWIQRKERMDILVVPITFITLSIVVGMRFD